MKINLLQKIINMHNFYVKYAKLLDICKCFSKYLVNELGNVPRRGVVPKFSDLEVIALSLTAESLSIDSENYLFAGLDQHRDLMPNLKSGRQFNIRRKLTISVCNTIRGNCSIFGDRGYICASMQLNLFETANIRIEVPCRLNQKDWKPTFIPFAKARKRDETDFSLFVKQFMLNRN